MKIAILLRRVAVNMRESDSINGTEDSVSDTEIGDVNNSNFSYNVAIQPVD